MNISVLNNSVNIAVDIDADNAVNAIATNTAIAVYSITRILLNRAVEDSRKVFEAGRTTRQVATALAQSTAIRAEIAIEDKVIAPANKVKDAIASPVGRAWNATLDGITDYLDSTPVKKADVAESLPIASEALEDIVAELEAQLPEATEACEPRIINGSLVTADGIVELPDYSAEDGKEVDIVNVSLSESLREEVATIL